MNMYKLLDFNIKPVHMDELEEWVGSGRSANFSRLIGDDFPISHEIHGVIIQRKKYVTVGTLGLMVNLTY